MNDVERYLVVGPSWVGDMVMAHSLFKLLARDNPCEIDVVAPAWSLPLLARMPEVRRGIELPLGHGQLGMSARRRIGHALRSESYHQAIILPRSWKSALIPFFARVSKRTGYRGEFRYGLLNDVRELDRQRLDQTVKKFLALGLPPELPLPNIPMPELRIDPANARALKARFDLKPDAVALMPGAAYGPAKCWPLEHFAELAREIIATGRQVWVLGSKADHAAGEQIGSRAGRATRNLCGETELADTVDLLSLTASAVTNDSGLMHVAAAAGTQVIAIYGSSSPAYTPPLTKQQRTLYLGLECSPCFKRECPLEHLRCLRDIEPAQVFASLGLR